MKPLGCYQLAVWTRLAWHGDYGQQDMVYNVQFYEGNEPAVRELVFALAAKTEGGKWEITRQVYPS